MGVERKEREERLEEWVEEKDGEEISRGCRLRR